MVQPANMVLEIVTVAAFAVGFRCLVVASPLGKYDMKPWNCDTCLCGWGAIIATAVMVLFTGSSFLTIESVIYPVAGTGFARVLLGLSNLGQEKFSDKAKSLETILAAMPEQLVTPSLEEGDEVAEKMWVESSEGNGDDEVEEGPGPRESTNTETR